jgi:hypothetical protein
MSILTVGSSPLEKEESSAPLPAIAQNEDILRKMVIDKGSPADRLRTLKLKGTSSHSLCAMTNTCASFSAAREKTKL